MYFSPFDIKRQMELSNANHDAFAVPFHLERIPKVLDKYDLMVANGLYDYIIDCVAKSDFSKQYIRNLRFKTNYEYERREIMRDNLYKLSPIIDSKPINMLY